MSIPRYRSWVRRYRNGRPISVQHRRWVRRVGVVAALAGLLAGATASPVQAHPHDESGFPPQFWGHCTPPSFVHIHTLDITSGSGFRDWLWGWEIKSVTPRFIKSEGRFSTNNTDSPQNVTFTSQESRTVSFTTTHQATNTVSRQFTFGLTIQTAFQLTRSVTTSTTTTLGVNVAATVPPRSTVQADYGVQVFDIGFIFRNYHRRPWDQPCRLQGEHGLQTVTVPTTDQGWQVSVIPASTPFGNSVYS